MAYFTLKNCCFFVNLRLGTFIIALICAVIEFIYLVFHFSAIWTLQELGDGSAHIFFLRFTLFVFFFFTCIKLALCVCLYVGLLEKRPDHLEIWYKGYMACEAVYVSLFILKAVKEADTDNTWFWFVIAGKVVVMLITVYFILVVRSYCYLMRRQPNFYQDFSYPSKKNNCGKIKDHGEIILFSAPIKEKDGITPDFVTGSVFATPQSSQMNIPDMPTTYLNEKRPSVDNVFADKETERRTSVSKPIAKRLSVNFDNYVQFQ